MSAANITGDLYDRRWSGRRRQIDVESFNPGDASNRKIMLSISDGDGLVIGLTLNVDDLLRAIGTVLS